MTRRSTSRALAVRKLGDAEADRILSVELQVRAVVFRAQLGPADVFQANQGSVGVRLQNDVLELRAR